uniref:Uncharacterized protein n=1 Tax=Clastoptera arizonana TaxID=38151 RepID=A0A1B6C3X9_9HEMI
MLKNRTKDVISHDRDENNTSNVVVALIDKLCDASTRITTALSYSNDGLKEKGNPDCNLCNIDAHEYKLYLKTIKVLDMIVKGVIEKEQIKKLKKIQSRVPTVSTNVNTHKNNMLFMQTKKNKPTINIKIQNNAKLKHNVKCFLIDLQRSIAELILQICFFKSQTELLNMRKQFDIPLINLKILNFEYTNLTDVITSLIEYEIESKILHRNKKYHKICITCLKREILNLINGINILLSETKNIKLVPRRSEKKQFKESCCHRYYPHIHGDINGSPVVLKFNQKKGNTSLGVQTDCQEDEFDTKSRTQSNNEIKSDNFNEDGIKTMIQSNDISQDMNLSKNSIGKYDLPVTKENSTQQSSNEESNIIYEENIKEKLDESKQLKEPANIPKENNSETDQSNNNSLSYIRIIQSLPMVVDDINDEQNQPDVLNKEQFNTKDSYTFNEANGPYIPSIESLDLKNTELDKYLNSKHIEIIESNVQIRHLHIQNPHNFTMTYKGLNGGIGDYISKLDSFPSHTKTIGSCSSISDAFDTCSSISDSLDTCSSLNNLYKSSLGPFITAKSIQKTHTSTLYKEENLKNSNELLKMTQHTQKSKSDQKVLIDSNASSNDINNETQKLEDLKHSTSVLSFLVHEEICKLYSSINIEMQEPLFLHKVIQEEIIEKLIVHNSYNKEPILGLDSVKTSSVNDLPVVIEQNFLTKSILEFLRIQFEAINSMQIKNKLEYKNNFKSKKVIKKVRVKKSRHLFCKKNVKKRKSRNLNIVNKTNQTGRSVLNSKMFCAKIPNSISFKVCLKLPKPKFGVEYFETKRIFNISLNLKFHVLVLEPKHFPSYNNILKYPKYKKIKNKVLHPTKIKFGSKRPYLLIHKCALQQISPNLYVIKTVSILNLIRFMPTSHCRKCYDKLHIDPILFDSVLDRKYFHLLNINNRITQREKYKHTNKKKLCFSKVN